MKKLSFLILLITIIACQEADKGGNPAPLTPPKTAIHALKNVAPDLLSDLGAWFGIQLPNDSKAGLGQPFIMSDSNGYWLPMDLFSLSILENGEKANLKVNSFALPGKLVQEITSQHSFYRLESIFANGQIVLTQCLIQNNSTDSLHYTLNWQFLNVPIIATINKEAQYDLGNASLTINLDSTCLHSFELPPNSSKKAYLSISHQFKNEPIR